ncbi:MAG: phage/plasmid primase, P4 family, partial [Desulfobacteraceae bacterium]|nr:phage/plasmid primase, P4 family [Desulfobacteraceae bacterium]
MKSKPPETVNPGSEPGKTRNSLKDECLDSKKPSAKGQEISTRSALEEARAAANRGWRVFPITAKAKKPPLVKDWENQASKDSDQIKWWSKRHPGCNWGIACGPSGLTVVDIDPKNGGNETYAELKANPETQFSQTRACITQSKGLHLFYAGATPKSTTGQIGPGIDTRSTGGYVVLAGSKTERGGYTWRNSAPLTSIPAWIRDRIGGSVERDARRDIPACDLDTPANTMAAIRYAEIAEPSIENQRGNNNAFQVVCGMRDLGVSEPACLKILAEEWNPRCLPPWSFEELRQLVENGYSYAKKQAGNTAPDTIAEGFQDLGDTPAGIAAEQGGKKVVQATVADAVIRSFGRENLIEALGSTWLYCEGLWRKADPREIKQAIYRHLPASKITAHAANSILDILRTKIYRQGHQFDADLRAICCLNGELHWDGLNWDFRPHQRESYRTTRLPVIYEPRAKAPRFEQFLREIFEPDPDHLEKAILVREVIGYSLLSTCELEKFILTIGNGANGKSALLDVVASLAGPEHAVSVQPTQFANRFQLAHLHGKLVNIVTEIAVGHVMADEALKALVSGELVTAERKHCDPFQFRPFVTFWFACNHMPATRDFSDALFRRAVIIKFNRTFAEHEQDPKLREKLRGELPGILNLALDAIAEVLKRGIFTRVESCEDAKAEWRLDADQVAQFLEDRCACGEGLTSPSREIYEAYRVW